MNTTNPHRYRNSSEAGFTLMELLIAIILVSILAGLAAPAYSSFIASQRAKSIATDLFSSLLIARSEAISKNSNVSLSPKSGDWLNGWQVKAADNTVLDDQGSITGATIALTPDGTTSIIYSASGRLKTSAPIFVITTTYGSSAVNQCVSVSLSGRPYIKASSTC